MVKPDLANRPPIGQKRHDGESGDHYASSSGFKIVRGACDLPPSAYREASPPTLIRPMKVPTAPPNGATSMLPIAPAPSAASNRLSTSASPSGRSLRR